MVVQALLACGIAHGDIKSENVLVKNTHEGTAENWVAQLSDFGNVVMGLHSPSCTAQQMFYTEPYNPPELPNSLGMVEPSLVEKADIWGWAMLLWFVMVDGTLIERNFWMYGDPDSSKSEMQVIDQREILRYKQTDRLGPVASRTCSTYLSSTHAPSEIGLVREITDILNTILVKDASKRPSIKETYQKLGKSVFGSDPFWATQRDPYPEIADEPRPTSKMPFFSVSSTPLKKPEESFLKIPDHPAF